MNDPSTRGPAPGSGAAHLSAGPFRIGPWHVDPGACSVSAGEHRERLEPRAMSVLLLLAANAGRTVPRTELLDRVWNTRYVVEEALTKCISQLRQALGDDPRQPRFIQTIPKLGYRLLVAPQSADDGAAADASAAGNDALSEAAPPAGPVAAVAADAPAQIAAPPRRMRGAWLAAAIGIAALLVSALWYSRSSTRDASFALEPGTGLAEFTSAPLAIAPDGKAIVLALVDADGGQLWRRDLSSGALVRIPGTQGATSPFISPDGQWIAYAAGGKIRRIAISGGESQVVADAQQFFGGCWLGNDAIVYAPRFARGLWRVPASGGTPKPLTRPTGEDSAHIWPACLPDARTVLFSRWRGGSQVDESAIGFVLADGSAGGTLLEGGYFPRYLADGRLLFARVGTVMAVPFDPASRRLRGAPRTLVRGVLTNVNSQVAFFETSNTAHLAVVKGRYEQPQRRLLWVDRAGRQAPASALARPFSSPRLSPDGRRIATWLQDDAVGIWLLDLDGDQLSRLSRGIDDHSPVWSPDGRSIVFDSSRTGHYQLYLAPADGLGAETQLTEGPRDHFANDWLPDGRLLFTASSEDRGSDLWAVEPRRGATPELLLGTPFSEGEAAVAPDGKRMAYVSDDSGRKEVYVTGLPPGGRRLQASREGGEEPRWSTAGDELYFRSGREILAVRIPPGAAQAPAPRTLVRGAFHTNLYSTRTWDLAPDGRFLMVEEPAPRPRTVEVILRAATLTAADD